MSEKQVLRPADHFKEEIPVLRPADHFKEEPAEVRVISVIVDELNNNGPLRAAIEKVK